MMMGSDLHVASSKGRRETPRCDGDFGANYSSGGALNNDARRKKRDQLSGALYSWGPITRVSDESRMLG